MKLTKKAERRLKDVARRLRIGLKFLQEREDMAVCIVHRKDRGNALSFVNPDGMAMDVIETRVGSDIQQIENALRAIELILETGQV